MMTRATVADRVLLGSWADEIAEARQSSLRPGWWILPGLVVGLLSYAVLAWALWPAPDMAALERVAMEEVR